MKWQANGLGMEPLMLQNRKKNGIAKCRCGNEKKREHEKKDKTYFTYLSFSQEFPAVHELILNRRMAVLQEKQHFPNFSQCYASHCRWWWLLYGDGNGDGGGERWWLALLSSKSMNMFSLAQAHTRHAHTPHTHTTHFSVQCSTVNSRLAPHFATLVHRSQRFFRTFQREIENVSFVDIAPKPNTVRILRSFTRCFFCTSRRKTFMGDTRKSKFQEFLLFSFIFFFSYFLDIARPSTSSSSPSSSSVDFGS